MSLLDWFRPKWRHSDPDVRAAAIKPLEDRGLVEKIARTDGDARVRRIAVNKIDDPELLRDLARAEADEALRHLIAERARRILVEKVRAGGEGGERALGLLSERADLVELAKSAGDESLRRAALARLTDDADRIEVARGAKENATRDAAIAAVTDGAKLRELAQKDPRKEVALAALARITDAEALAEIGEKTKSKAVRKAVTERLRALRGAGAPATNEPRKVASPAARSHARRVQLCRQLETLASAAGDDVARIEADVASARAEWSGLGEVPADEAELAKRFERGAQAAIARLDAWRRAAEERAAEERAQADAAEARRIADERRRAEEAERQKTQAEEAQREGEERAQRRAEGEQRQKEEEGRRAALSDEEKRAQAENLRRMEEVAAHVETLVGMADTRAAEKQLKDAQGVLASIGPAPREASQAVKERIRVAREQLMARVRESKDAEDWKRWANLSKLEDLCLRIDVLRQRVIVPPAGGAGAPAATGAEAAPAQAGASASTDTGGVPAVADVHAAVTEKVSVPLEVHDAVTTKVAASPAPGDDGIPLAEALQLLKALQEEWKKVGAAPREKSQALWQKFKRTADEIYGLSKQQFAEKDAERQRNLADKIALCEQAEQIASAATATGATPDWKLEAERIKAVQAAWKAIGPVPKAEADAVWKRFREACDRFFDRRKGEFEKLDAERAANWKKKTSLVEEVEAVADSPDVAEAIKVIKQVQAEWKTVGPVPRAQADAIWKRFRAACDRAFARARGGEHRAEAEAVAEAAPEAQAVEASAGEDEGRDAGETPSTGADEPKGS